jgi:hypothetical protein
MCKALTLHSKLLVPQHSDLTALVYQHHLGVLKNINAGLAGGVV